MDYQERPDARKDERWVDRVTTDGTWSGNLYDFYRTVIRKLESGLKVPFRVIGTDRVDATQVHVALREALVNAIVHADYSAHVSILIVKRPSLFGFRNPGTMRVSLQDAMRGGVSDCRNRTLQKLFQLAGLAEQAGSGVPKIFESWRAQHWRAPSLREKTEPDQTLLTLHLSSLFPDDTIEALDDRFGADFRNMTELERLALATVEIEGQVTHGRLMEMTDGHPSDVSKALQGLVRDGHLERFGATKASFYRFLGEVPELPEFELTEDAAFLEFLSSEHSESRSEHKRLSSDHKPPLPAQPAPPELERQVFHVQAVRRVRDTKRTNRDNVRAAILQVCSTDFATLDSIAEAVGRSAKTIRVHYLRAMVAEGFLELRFPERRTHPKQAYRVKRDRPDDSGQSSMP